MKLLYLEPNGPQNHPVVEGLRKSGLGVMYARNLQDAQIFMHAHAPSLDAIVTNDDGRQWAESLKALPDAAGVAFILATKRNSTESLKHQNSTHGANAYIESPVQVPNLTKALESVFGQKIETKGSSFEPSTGVFLEDVSQELAGDRESNTTIQFSAPTITLTNPFQKNEVEAVEFSAPDLEPVATLQPEPVAAKSVAPEVQTSPFQDLTLNSATEFGFEQELPTQLATDYSELEPTYDSPAISENATIPSSISPAEILNQYNSLRSEPLLNPHENSDEQTLRKYLNLREQDVAMLGAQLRATQERLQKLEEVLNVERARNAELAQLAQLQEEKLKHYDHEKKIELEIVQQQMREMEDSLREKSEKAISLETKLRHTAEEIQGIKERVKIDIRRIRVREKELENQLEILKKDSSALIVARDQKILDLKRKIDTLEFNMELVQEKYTRERANNDQYRQKLRDASDVMKRAGGILIEDAS